MKKRNFENLIVWQKSHQLVLGIYQATKNFPITEQFALTSQIKRAAYSVPANIVEGCVKSHLTFLNHLSIAQGSLEEVKYYLILAFDLDYLKKDRFDKLRESADEVSRILFIFKLKTKEMTGS